MCCVVPVPVPVQHLIEAVRYVSPVKAALKDSKKPPRQRGVTTDGAYQEGMDR